MRKAAARRFEVTLSACSVTRLLVVSYFVALGFGLVDGAEVAVLFLPFLPASASSILASALVIGLAALVLIGVKRRAAALLLAIVVFWSSYLTMVVQYTQNDIAVFWRDLALIGCLLLTHGTSQRSLHIDGSAAIRATRKRVGAMFSNRRTARTDAPVAQERRSNAQSSTSSAHPKRVRSELYRQDFEVVRLL